MSLIKNAIEFISSPTHPRTVGIIIVFFILAVVPLTVLVAQKQQEIRQRAAPLDCTNISSIQACSTINITPTVDKPCDTAIKCKVGNAIYECAEEKKQDSRIQ